MFAAQYGHLEIVKYLVDNGAIIDKEISGERGYTALSFSKSKEIIEYLVEKGASIKYLSSHL
jgi:ankyrin repeat protein